MTMISSAFICYAFLLHVIAVTAGAELTEEICNLSYGNRSFFPVELKRFPPVLYSYPGSGNTWLRLLVEYATGYYTSSHYNDKKLVKELPGEAHCCDNSTILLKLHPQISGYPFRRGIKSEAVVMLIRDPFDSLWSHFNIHVTRTHNMKVKRKKLDGDKGRAWRAFANQTICAYNKHWRKDYNKIAVQIPHTFIRYEDLLNPSTRIETLRNLVRFLNLATNEKRLECAFLLAVKKKILRISDHEAKPDSFVSKDEAFLSPYGGTEFVCNLWRTVAEHNERFGYTAYKNISCDNIPSSRIC